MKAHRFNYYWQIAGGYPAEGIKQNNRTVFSCFSGGGGSTMGYKLAGFNVIGCNEIDPKMMATYIKNHNPKFSYLEPIQEFKKRKDLPDELYNLDILDGSPPCSSFSITGNREKDWGKKKKFREGQAAQILDNLFFDFIDLAKRLQPKIVIAENVKGLLMGGAKTYVKRIYDSFNKAGFYCQHFLLNAADMGVPQKRERVFFISIRKDLSDALPNKKDLFNSSPFLDLKFSEPPITWGEIIDISDNENNLNKLDSYLWEHKKEGDIDLSDASIRERGILSRFNAKFLYKNKIPNTIIGCEGCILFDKKRKRNKLELIKCGSFPIDYNFLNNDPGYIIGMSVPPLMIAQISNQIFLQWLKKI